MTGRLVDMAFTLGGKQRVTLEINGDFREIWDKLHQEPVLDVEIKKHREKRSLSANAYFHVLCNKISAETGESEDAVKRRLVVSYGALARDKDGKPVGLKLPPTVDPSDFYPYVRLYETRQENGKDYTFKTCSLGGIVWQLTSASLRCACPMRFLTKSVFLQPKSIGPSRTT